MPETSQEQDQTCFVNSGESFEAREVNRYLSPESVLTDQKVRWGKIKQDFRN